MTYNFDPDQWLAIRLAGLDGARARGELEDDAYRRQRQELEQRYETMVERLDGTYRLPGQRPTSQVEPGDDD